ncbi:MAG TPA: alanine racemase, partial [Gammaproteobacteria bacterium]|nr:alanine racemase [Gammaproteobacteria bacterium]
RLCPDSTIVPVIKSDAYGHGMNEIARAIAGANIDITCCAVASLDEALALKQLNTGMRVLLLAGFANGDELKTLLNNGIDFVVQARYQLSELVKALDDLTPTDKIRIWVKLDTGMHRLGLTQADCLEVFQKLHDHPAIEKLILMSHLACADDTEGPGAEMTRGQIEQFNKALLEIAGLINAVPQASLAASAGIITWPETHYQTVRPGIMLYGGSPFAGKTGNDLGLQAVMTLYSRLIAVKDLAAGDSIGYGATFTCDTKTQVGVVSIGYGDGYPRSARNGTPVLIRKKDRVIRTRMIGRVSMDMITIDLTDLEEVDVGDEIILWGDGLAADEVADYCDTLSYELFCRVTDRVEFIYG